MSSFKKCVIVVSLFALFFVSRAMAETMNGKEVKRHVGQVLMLNVEQGGIEIKLLDEKATGNWKIDGSTVVFFHGLPQPLAAVLKSKRVRVWVTKEGYLPRIDILEMNP